MDNNKDLQDVDGKVLRQKAMTFFYLAIGVLVMFVIIYCIFAFSYKNPQASIIASGLFVTLYFAYQGYHLLDICNKNQYEVEKYICSAIEKTGYRRQNRKVIFLRDKDKETFVYNTNKNMSFIEGMEYDIYFKKSEYKTSNNVLAISLSNTQENYAPHKESNNK